MRNPSLLNHAGLRRHAKLKVGLTLSSMKFDWARQVGEQRGCVGGERKRKVGLTFDRWVNREGVLVVRESGRWVNREGVLVVRES